MVQQSAKPTYLPLLLSFSPVSFALSTAHIGLIFPPPQSDGNSPVQPTFIHVVQTAVSHLGHGLWAIPRRRRCLCMTAGAEGGEGEDMCICSENRQHSTLFLTLSLSRPFSVTLFRLDAQEEKQQLFSIHPPLQKKACLLGRRCDTSGTPFMYTLGVYGAAFSA